MITRLRRHACFRRVKVSEFESDEEGEEDGDAEGEEGFEGCPPGGLLHLLTWKGEIWLEGGRWEW